MADITKYIANNVYIIALLKVLYDHY